MSDINIAEPFLAKEGRLRLPKSLSDMEVRITTAPVAGGNAVALRLFDRHNIFLPLENLGMSDNGFQAVREMLRLGEGLVLVTGPTGSGKTTTVYSMLEKLGGTDKNIVAVEDPVEFAVPFVRQINVDTAHGITMTSGLRTILRMDPDVVFLGEIRDGEAARIAMRAASSGKYVLSTLHTRDVASTITALRDVDIADRSIAGNLTGIINQRLLRRLCPKCKKPQALTPVHQQRFKIANLPVPDELCVPKGCDACRHTGFQGRTGVFEGALIREAIADAINESDSERNLHELLRSTGVVSLTTDALTKVSAGVTSIDEALNVHWLS
jgi:type II secretory ATPase GspE/PulE/Tfp pilus assembly ATPase PilB-like protein